MSFTFGSEQLYRVDTFYGGNTDTNALFSGTNHASLNDELYNISSEPDAHDCDGWKSLTSCNVEFRE